MKRVLYLFLILLLFLPLMGVKAQHVTSYSLGLKGKVESYDITSMSIVDDGQDLYYREVASFNVDNGELYKLLLNGDRFGYSIFNYKGKTAWLRYVTTDNAGRSYVVYHKFKYGKNGLPISYERLRKCYATSYQWETEYYCTYSDYKFDQFGNWIGRKAHRLIGTWFGGDDSYDMREITYEKKWYHAQIQERERAELNSLEKKGDLRRIRAFYEGCDESFKNEVIKFWNSRIFNQKHTLDELLDISGYGIATKETKDKAIRLWNEQVFKEKLNLDDYRNIVGNILSTKESKEKARALWSKEVYRNNIEDVDRLYEMTKDTMITQLYVDSIRMCWNTAKWKNIDKQSYSEIAALANHPFCFPDSSSCGWNRVQQLYFSHEVMRRTDFRQVDDDLAKTIGGRKVFENVGLRNRVIARRDSLRNAEIADNLAQARQAESDKDIEKAISKAQHVLSIDPNNATAISLSADNGYAYLKKLKRQNRITDDDYATYVSQNPWGKYTVEIQDERALTLAKQAHSKKDVAAFTDIFRLPMSQYVYKKVNSYDKRTLKRSVRGNFLHLGVEGMAGYAFGPQLTEYGGGANIRLGWTTAPINVVTGFDYMVHHATYVGDKDFDKLNPIYRGAIDYTTMEIPLQLRWNVTHGINAFYLAVGAQYNFNRKAKLIFHEPFSDADEKSLKDARLLKKNNFVGYYSIGYEISGIVGLELYVKHDLTDRFDKDYVRSTYCDESQSIQLLEKSKKTQIDGKNWTIGLKMRISY